MAGIEVANANLVLKATPQTPGAWTPGTIVPTLILATKAKAGGAFIAIQEIQWIVTGCTNPLGALVPPSVVDTPITATATKMKCDGQFVIRKGDAGVCSGTQTAPPPPPKTIACKCDIVVDDPGQTQVLAS